jgi:ubiquinone biosynthesis protein COQ9
VQWIREVTMLRATGWRREVEEAVLTTIYLATFACWIADATAGSRRTRDLLWRLLGAAPFSS